MYTHGNLRFLARIVGLGTGAQRTVGLGTGAQRTFRLGTGAQRTVGLGTGAQRTVGLGTVAQRTGAHEPNSFVMSGFWLEVHTCFAQITIP